MKIINKSTINLNEAVPVYDISVADDIHNFKLSAGPIVHNCGTKAVNALSDEFIMVTRIINKNTKFPSHLAYKGEKWYYLKYAKGEKQAEGFLKNLKSLGLDDLADYTTIVSFVPDLTIYSTSNYTIPQGLDYVLKIAEMDKKKLNVLVNDEPYESKIEDYEYRFDVTLQGIKGGKNPKVRLFGSFGFNGDILSKNTIGCVNSIAVHRGIHVDMFREAYKSATRELYGDCGGMEDNGVDANVFILANEVDFDSQTKTKLSRIPEFNKNDITKLKNAIKDIMKDNDEAFRDNYMKIINLRNQKGELNKKQALIAALGDLDDNSVRGQRRSDSFKPKRLKDAWSKKRDQCELIVTEGNSAISSAHKTRNPEFQALFPMRGVCKNTAGLDIVDVLKNEEMNELFRSIGAGVDGFSNLDKIRYGKIIYCSDADEDGCFPGETLVHTLEYGDISFEDLVKYHANDKFHVFSKDVSNNLVIGTAHHPRVTRYVQDLIQLNYDNGSCTRCTTDHKFFTNDCTYVEAKDLTEMNSISTIKNYNHKLQSKDYIHFDSPIPVYDLTVDTYENFALSNGEVVHNCRITALFVGAFGQHAKFLIEAGKVYLCETPFYIQDNKEIYAEDADDALDKNKPFDRIKGLGGLGSHFHNAVTNVNTRRLIQVTPEMLNEALEILKSGAKKKSLLEETGVISNKVWGSKNGKEK